MSVAGDGERPTPSSPNPGCRTDHRMNHLQRGDNSASTAAISASKATRLLPVLLVAVFLVAIFLLLVDASLHKQLNHDENMYISAGVLLSRGQLPYRDFPYFQMPLLPLAYASFLWSSSDLLLAARLFNTVCAFVTCLVLFFGALRMSRVLSGAASPLSRGLPAVCGVLLFVSNPEMVYAGGLAWNHDLPIALTALGLALLVWSFTSKRGVLLLLVSSGLLFGLAVAARLSFATAVPPVALLVLLVPPFADAQEGTSRLLRFLAHCAGVATGLLPAIVLWLAGPTAFWFGNVSYHWLNGRFWAQSGYTRAMTLDGKIAYLFDVVRGEPLNWLLPGGCALVVLLVWRNGGRDGNRLAVYMSAITAVSLLASALVPSPTWLQYFYAPYVFVLFAFVYGASCLAAGRWGSVSRLALLATTMLAVIAVVPSYQALTGSFAASDWTPEQVQRVALEIRTDVTRGTVATMAPIYALDAGLDIYPQLASGPFAPRVASFLPTEDRTSLIVLSGHELTALLSRKPPDALLVGAEGAPEDPLVQFATHHAYRKVLLSNGLTLWVSH